MQRAVRIRLLSTKEQEILFWKSAGTARWAYNYFLDANEQAYKEGRRITEGEVRKYINNVLKKTTHTWLKRPHLHLFCMRSQAGQGFERCHQLSKLQSSLENFTDKKL